MKIFLGYASEHLDTATEVYAFLHDELGHDVWFDKKALLGGVDWDQERLKGQSEADLMVHLCSLEIMNRPGVVNRELRTTLKLVEDQPFGSLYAIFMRLNDFRLPAELLRFQYIDHFDSDWKERLSAAVGKRRDQLAGRPTTPLMHIDLPALIPPSVTSTTEPELVRFSTETPLFEASGAYLKYPGGDDLYWLYVNAQNASHSLESYFPAVTQLDEFSSDDNHPDDDRAYYFNTTPEEFFRHGDIISLRYYTTTHYGGAHPNHHITTLNFLGKKWGSVEIKDLLVFEYSNAKTILDFCEKVLMATFPDFANHDDVFGYYAQDKEAVWSLISQFNIDRRGLTINFSPYDVLPYAFGLHEVVVPWIFIEDMLGNDFKNLEETITRKWE